MGRLRVLSGGEVCTVLAKHGFIEVGKKGSHIIMQRKQGSSTTSVPIPDHKELCPGTVLAIIRQSGVPRIEFEL